MCSFGFTALEVAFMVNRLCCLGSEVRQYILMQVHVWEINSFQGGWDSVRRRKDLGVLELHQRDTLTPLMKVSIIFILIGSSIYQYNWLWNSLYQMGCGRYLSKPLSGYSEIWAIFKNKSSGQSNNQHLVFLGGSLMHRTSFPAVHIQTEVVWWLIIFFWMHSVCVYKCACVCVCVSEDGSMQQHIHGEWKLYHLPSFMELGHYSDSILCIIGYWSLELVQIMQSLSDGLWEIPLSPVSL